MAQLLPIFPDRIERLLGRAKSGAEAAGNVDIAPSARLLARIQSGEIKKPTTLRELINIKTLTYSLAASAAVGLGIPLGNMKVDGNTSVFVQDYAQYREYIDGEERVLFGVSVRYSIAFRKLDIKVNLTSLPMIAAAAQLNLAEASAKFDVMGMNSPKIADLVPVVAQLDVDAYAKYAEALQGIKRLISDTDTYIEPVVLAVLGEQH